MLATEKMPTALKKVTVVLDPAIQAALEAYAARSRRSLSNAASILLEQALIVTGDLEGPIVREEKRGGKRENAGRPKVAPPSDHPLAQDSTSDDGNPGDGQK
jgi:hypothetical protein